MLPESNHTEVISEMLAFNHSSDGKSSALTIKWQGHILKIHQNYTHALTEKEAQSQLPKILNQMLLLIDLNRMKNDKEPKSLTLETESKETIHATVLLEQPLTNVNSYQITPEELNILLNPNSDSIFKGFNLLMKNSYLDDILESQSSTKADTLTVGTITDDTKDLMLNEGMLKELLEKHPDAKFIMIPVNRNLHYTAFFINVLSGDILHYNSKNHQSLNPLENEIVQFINRFFYQKNIKFNLHSNTVFPQKDGWSCGFNVLNFFGDCMAGKSLNQIDQEPIFYEKLRTQLNNYIGHLAKKQMEIPTDCKSYWEELERNPSPQAAVQEIIKLIEKSNPNPPGKKRKMLATILIHMREKNLAKDSLISLNLSKDQRHALYQLLTTIEQDREELVNDFLENYRQIHGQPLGD